MRNQTSIIKQVAFASTLFVMGSFPALATANNGSSTGGRSLLDFVKSIKDLVTASTDLTYSLIMLAGLIFVAGGILAWIFASKTNNQQQTRGYAGTAFVGGMLLCSIMAVINMGSHTGTGATSELDAFYQSTQSSSTSTGG